jgi:hypothetical protein
MEIDQEATTAERTEVRARTPGVDCHAGPSRLAMT